MSVESQNISTEPDAYENKLSIKKRALFTLILFFIFLVLLEVALRLFGIPRELRQDGGLAYNADNAIGYEYTANWSGYYAGAMTHINSAGLRGKDFSVVKPDGTIRILGVGDSFTFGKAVDDEDVYLAQLERLLNQEGSKSYETINAGHDGLNTFIELRYLKERDLMSLKPDAVVLGFTMSNDAELEYFDNRLILRSQAREASPLLDLTESKSYRRLANWLRLARIFKSGAEWMKRDLITNLSFKLEMRSYSEGSETWEICRNSLLGFYDVCRQNNVPLVVVLFPIGTKELDQTYKDYPKEFLKIHEQLKAVFKDKSNVAVVEVLDELAATNLTSRELQAPIDGHPNQVYHEAVARKLYETIKELGL